MFLLISGRHVGAHADGHQHGLYIQISINLGKTFLRISRLRKIAVIWILARVFAIYLLPFSRFWTLSIERLFSFYLDMAWHWKPAIAEIWFRCRTSESNRVISLISTVGYTCCCLSDIWYLLCYLAQHHKNVPTAVVWAAVSCFYHFLWPELVKGARSRCFR